MVHYLILCLLFCSGCYQKPQNISSKRTQLHLSLRYDPLTLDPRKNSDPVSCSVINFLYTGLTQLEADGSISLNLADSIEASKGYTKYTFHLKDALWSNGEPITAYDFEYSWKKLLSPSFNSLNAHFLYPIKNAKLAKLGLVSTEEVAIFVEDAKTFYVRLEQPNTYFPKVLAFATCFPIWKNTKDPDDKNNAKVFSGAYILEDWKPNDSILLKKNPYYWNTENILIDTVKLHIVHDEQTILQLYQKNELDCIGSVVSPIPHDLIPHVKNSQEACSSDQAGTTFCFFNIQSFPFNNLNIRKAFYYAINKQELIDHILQNNERKAYGIIPPILKNSKVTKFTPEESLELAKHHLHLGLKELSLSLDDFPSLVFCYYMSDLEKNLALALQSQWKKTLGISVQLEGLEVKSFLDKLYKKNYQFCQMSILAQYFDPMSFLERFVYVDGLKNFSGWENEEYQRLIKTSFNAKSSQERLNLLEAAEAVLMSDLPIAPIYHHKGLYLHHSNLQGVAMNPLGALDYTRCCFH